MNRAIGFAAGFLTLTSYAVAGIPNTQTQTFLDATGAKAQFNDRDRLVALYAVPMETNPPPVPEPINQVESDALVDDFIDDFVDAHADAFGVQGVQLSPLGDGITIRDGKFRVRKYSQVKIVDTETLTVHGAVVTIPALIMPDQEQRIAYVGIRLVPMPEYFPVQTVDESEADDSVKNIATYSELTFDDPVKVIYEDSSQVVHRAWRFMGSSSEDSYLFFVDVADGSLIHVVNLRADSVVSGAVSGYATNLQPGDPLDHRADGPDNTPVSTPIPGVQVSLYRDATGECPSSEGTYVDTQPTDVDGAFEFLNVSDQWTGLRLRTELAGDWVRVIDYFPNRKLEDCRDDVESAPTNVGLQLNPLPQDNNWTYPEDSYGTAQVNAFRVATAAHDFFKGHQPTFTAMDTQVELRVNWAGDCGGAFAHPFLNPLSITLPAGFYGGNGTGCHNAAFSTIVSHEYMHLIQGRLFGLGGFDEPRFTEATSDVFASLQWGTPYFGQSVVGVEPDGTRKFIRRLDTPDVQSSCDPVTGPGDPEWEDCPCHSEDDYHCAIYAQQPHCCGLALGGSFWDMRTALIAANPSGGADTANELFADFMFVTDGAWDNSLLLELLVVDDDDGDLTDNPPTPHSHQIIPAFNAHGFYVLTCINCDDVRVEWDIIGTEPSIVNGDYSVVYQTDPPNVVLHTTVVDSDPVTRWTIGRLRHPVTNAVQDIGTVTAVWNEPREFDIERLEIGSNSNAPVRNVYIVDIPTQSTNNWTSLRFDIRGDLLIRASAHAASPICVGGGNDGGPCEESSDCPNGACTRRGGRISGVIDGNANVINAEAIGVGVGDAGVAELTVLGDQLGAATIASIPSGKTFQANILKWSLNVTEDFAGTITLAEVLGTPSSLGTGAEGFLHIACSASGSVTIGEVSGISLFQTASVQIDGPFSGIMTIGKMTPSPDQFQYDPRIQVGTLTGTIQVTDSITQMEGSIEIGSLSQSADVEAGGLIDIVPKVGAFGAIKIHGNVDAGALIKAWQGVDLNGSIAIDNNVAGVIEIGATMEPIPFVGDVFGNITIGGQLSGTLQHQGRVLRDGNNAGTIEVQSIATGGRYIQPFFDLDPEHTWDGELLVHGDVYGTIDVRSSLGPDALVSVSGTLGQPGRIKLKQGLRIDSLLEVDGDVAGNIELGVSTENPPSVGDVLGEIQIGGQLAGNIVHFGTTPASGMFDIGSVLATGKYTQTFNSPLAEWGGTLTVNGNMAGTLSFQTKLQDADLTVEGSMSGTIKTGEMYSSSIALNTVGYCSASTSGSILIGNKYTVWTPDPDTHIVNLGNIDVWGDFASTALLKISKYQPTELISAFGTICYHRHMYGQEQVGVTNGTPPAILHCPTGQDPCCPGC